jgi:hypothetical protein
VLRVFYCFAVHLLLSLNLGYHSPPQFSCPRRYWLQENLDATRALDTARTLLLRIKTGVGIAIDLTAGLQFQTVHDFLFSGPALGPTQSPVH